jgi:hypothetical protein
LKPGTGPLPDFSGTVLLIWDASGTAYVRTGLVSTTTWAAAGSSPLQAHWQLSDALS